MFSVQLQTTVEDFKMSRYGMEETNSCVETQKDLKKRLKNRKMVLEDFIDMTKVIDIDWKEKQVVIGGLYLEIKDMKTRLKGK